MTIQPATATPPKAQACSECGAAFYPRRDDQSFCSVPCRRAWHRRREVRGTELYDFAMRWRRRRIKGAFAAMTAIVDEWLREDRERASARRGKATS